jgi:hypothetical protein
MTVSRQSGQMAATRSLAEVTEQAIHPLYTQAAYGCHAPAPSRYTSSHPASPLTLKSLKSELSRLTNRNKRSIIDSDRTNKAPLPFPRRLRGVRSLPRPLQGVRSLPRPLREVRSLPRLLRGVRSLPRLLREVRSLPRPLRERPTGGAVPLPFPPQIGGDEGGGEQPDVTCTYLFTAYLPAAIPPHHRAALCPIRPTAL